MTTLALGLISGTSVDGIDAALVVITGQGYDLTIETLAAETFKYPRELQQQLLALGEGEKINALTFGQLHREVGIVFGDVVCELLKKTPYSTQEIHLLGSHGQTIAHQPPTTDSFGFSVQLGDGAVIAQRTGIITVNNFRARDMAYGGQGAPLVPWVDWILLRHPQEHRCIQNIGGIGNVAYLPANAQPEDVMAFDTGPGNMMMDYLVQHFTQGHQRYDAGGQWAAQGEIHAPLLTALLTDSYLQLPPPKSTGRERYGRSFVIDLLHRFPGLSEADYLATFTEFTAQSIALSYEQFLPRLPDSLWLCGGGVHNNFLKVRLQHALPSVHIGSTAQIGVDPDYKEAIAFAVLAYLHQHQLPGNLPLCTHAQQAVVLGDLHPA